MEPISVGSLNVEATMRAEGSPRRMLRMIVSSSGGRMMGHARVIVPPTTTVSGERPTIKFEMPMPR